ncbi:hypothetical protein QN386_22295 [Pseudomonas sp. CCI3.2]|uniref:hypothetical protein n=1 Tax=unclassified Pseudomonas TaxID=196821 RepID=UPI002B22AF28|nr:MULTISPECIES: hypothetical protein [unclassified Pseudomonas]MEB0078028.1 hypothetical protein [Pseudomonas sp. MH10out]MEB0104035.1 hypothetical protein [Pseudomonas sp. CCI3.2]MEB0133548.1 hypothetical protein [Pseudomonas sp. CCI2.4]
MSVLRQRQQPYRSRQWLAAVHQIENCVICGAYGVQAAHINEGKGMSQKTDDCLCAAICETCHTGLDNGKQYSRDDRREILRKAVLDTVAQLARMGLLTIKGAA